MKILYVTTVGITMTFFKNIVRKLLDDGHIVDIATNESEEYQVPECYKEWGCKIYQISTSRSPFSMGNFKAIKQIRNIAKDYDIVHCHTPLAGMAARQGCKKLRKTQGLKVIYTAHGFHFYKGAPKKNWMIFYPIEKSSSKYTDVLITVNHEDFALAKEKMKAKETRYVPGVGMDVDKFFNTKVDVSKKREEIGVPTDAKVVLSVGELNENKNHQLAIRALANITPRDNIHYVIAGVGDQKEKLEKLASELGVNLHLLGFRRDVAELYKIADLYVHPSYREGLPVALMEAMASKVDAVCSNIRGSNDLVSNGLFDPKSVDSLTEVLKRFLVNGESSKEENFEKIHQFSITKVNDDIYDIYGIKR